MNVLHVIPSLSPKHGGPSFALPAITRALALHGVRTSIATTDDDGPGARLSVPIGERLPDKRASNETIFFRKNTEFYKFSFGLRRWLTRHAAEYDVVHIHGLFSYSSVAAAKAAQRASVPYIVRPLGVLNQWGIVNRRGFLKQWSLRFVELPLLQQAAAMHYTSEAEHAEAAETVPQLAAKRSAILPLPIEAAQPGDGVHFFAKHPDAVGKRVVLFLSRIDRKKGVELLLAAYAQIAVQNDDLILVIAGDGKAEYVRELRERAHDLGISQSVIWSGFLAGAEKADAYVAATVYVLPSYSENFGIAAAEALAAGVPTILTEGVALSAAVRAADAGLVVRPQAGAIVDAILQLLRDPQAAARFANTGRQLMKDHYSSEAVGEELVRLYTLVKGNP